MKSFLIGLLICVVVLGGSFLDNAAAAKNKKHGMCSDYGSKTDMQGNPYYVKNEDGRVWRTHGGIDFCTVAGADVLAPVDGQIWEIEWDNEIRGGTIYIKTDIFLKSSEPDAPLQPLFVATLHIDPDRKLRAMQWVKAGDVIGKVQKGGKEQIGPIPHVHLAASKCWKTWIECLQNPNDYWADGPRKITCFDADNPPPPKKFVAPVRCK